MWYSLLSGERFWNQFGCFCTKFVWYNTTFRSAKRVEARLAHRELGNDPDRALRGRVGNSEGGTAWQRKRQRLSRASFR